MRKLRLSGKKGFTLMELMIVIGIIGLIAMIAYPSFSSSKKDNSLYSEARKLMSDIRYVQQLAMDTQSSWKIVFNTTGYIVFDGTKTYSASYSRSDVNKSVNFENAVAFDAAQSTGMDTEAGGTMSFTFKKDAAIDISTNNADKLIVLKSGTGSFIYITVQTGGKVDIKWTH